MRKTVIVVSGPPGSGTTTIGKEIAKKLKLNFFSPGLYYKRLSKKRREGKAALEVWKTRYSKLKKIHKYIDNLQIKKAKEGNILIEGSLSIHFLKDLTDKKIWLDAPLKVRAQRTAKRENVSYNQALKEIQEREKIERIEWKKIYGFDYFNQKKDADLVIDSSNLTITHTVNKILDFIKRKQAFNS